MCPTKWRLLRTLVNSLSPRHCEIGRRRRDSARDTSRERADLQRGRWHLLWGPKTAVTLPLPGLRPLPSFLPDLHGKNEQLELSKDGEVTAQTSLASHFVWFTESGPKQEI